MNSSHKERSVKSSKRKAILQAAWKLIRHYGFAKTTIDDIAQSAGVGKGTVYLHFGSKSDIMLALVELTNERITKQLEKLAAKDTPPEQRLHECLLYRVMTLFDLVHRYPHSADVVSLMMTDIVERLDQYVRRHGELLCEIVKQGCDQGVFSVDDPAKCGILMAGVFELLTPPYYRFKSRTELEQFATSIFELAINGIATTTIVLDKKTS